MALSRTASEPGLKANGSASLKAAAALGLSNCNSAANLTTTLYDKMMSEGRIRDDVAPKIRASGRSITIPLADSAERDLQPETYFPLPQTPMHERKFRRMSHGPGEVLVHHGLKAQRLPGEEFRYGIRGVKGSTTEDAMKAGQLLGVAEYKNSVNEMVYDSVKREPIGRPHIRGHNLKMLPEGFGSSSGLPVDSKYVVFPVEAPADLEEHLAQYRKTHNSYRPGERIDRSYTWPEATQDEKFMFGAGAAHAVEGAGAKMALNMDVEDDGTFKQTKLVQKVCEDYRNVQHPKVFEKVHAKQGATGPAIGADYRFGIKSTISDYTAGSCIKGYYSLEDQLPDQDLGRCTKLGRRNVTTETRAFGLPSVRTDIPAPHPSKRSCGDRISYGDEPSAAAILNPQRFDNKGVPDREFLVRRAKDELAALVEQVPLGDIAFEELWESCLPLFDDGLPLVSLDALLYVHSKRVEDNVAAQMKGLHLMVGSATAAATI